MSNELRNMEAVGWRRTKGLLWFYLIILGSIMPLVWLPASWEVPAMLVVGALDAVIVAIGCRRLGGVHLSELDPRQCRAFGLILAVGLTLATLVVNFGYHHLVIEMFGLGKQPSINQPFADHGYGLLISILVICIEPAIVEELAFRGVIYAGLKRIAGHREAIIISGLAFGIIHASWVSLPYLAGLGLALGWLRYRTGSLLPGMLMHGLHNLAVLLIAS